MRVPGQIGPTLLRSMMLYKRGMRTRLCRAVRLWCIGLEVVIRKIHGAQYVPESLRAQQRDAIATRAFELRGNGSAPGHTFDVQSLSRAAAMAYLCTACQRDVI